MKIKSLIFVTAIFALMNAGCSDKKEEPKNVQKRDFDEKNVNSFASSIVVEPEQFNLNELGVPAFLSAEKEFSSKWNYAGSKKILKRIVDKICRTERRCARRVDSVAYRKDCFFILDSLMRNKYLDSLIVDAQRRDYGRANSEEHEKKVKKILDSLVKHRKNVDK